MKREPQAPLRHLAIAALLCACGEGSAGAPTERGPNPSMPMAGTAGAISLPSGGAGAGGSPSAPFGGAGGSGSGTAGSPGGAGSGGQALAGAGGEGGSSVRRSTGCGREPSMPLGWLPDQTMSVAGLTRQYDVIYPENYDKNRAYPLLFSLHGGMSRGKPRDHLVETFDQGAIYLFPDSLSPDGRWDNQGDTDLVLIDALIAQTSEKWCVDLNALFATGNSQGGRFTATLGCKRGDVFRMVAPKNPGPPSGTGDLRLQDCVGNVASLTISTLDDASHYDTSVHNHDVLAEHNGCGKDTTTYSSPLTGDVACEQNTGCPGKYPQLFCRPPGTHTTEWLQSKQSVAALLFQQLLAQDTTMP